MKNTSGPEETNAGSGVLVEEDAAEAKRLAARRRFLLGGAAAVPLIVTLGQKEAWAASAAVCQSLGMSYDKKYVRTQVQEKYANDDNDDNDNDDNDDNDNDDGGLSRGWRHSLYCDPKRRWTKFG